MFYTDKEPTYDAYFNPYYFSDGKIHNIGVIAEDMNGNISLPVTIEIIIPADLENFPKLVSPINNEFICSDTSVVFTWNSFTDAISYNLVIAQDPEFSGIVYDTTIEDTTYSFKPYTNDRHYWKIRAINQLGNLSNWSITNSFYYDDQIAFSKSYLIKENNHLLDVIQLANGDFLSSSVYHTNYNYNSFVFKTNKFGDLLWYKDYENESWNFRGDIILSDDNEFVSAGNTENDISLIKFDTNGEIIWSIEFPTEVGSKSQTAIKTLDGGYAIVGYERNNDHNVYDAKVIKTDSSGKFEWEYLSSHILQKGLDIIQNEAGEYILTSETRYSVMDNRFLYITKLDSEGNRIWSESIGYYGVDNGSAYIQQSNNGYLIAGIRQLDIFVVEIDESCSVLWGNTYSFGSFNYTRSLEKTLDNNYILSAKLFDNETYKLTLLLLKLDNNGTIIWEKHYDKSVYNFFPSSCRPCYDYGFIVGGFDEIDDSSYLWFQKTDKNGDSFGYMK